MSDNVVRPAKFKQRDEEERRHSEAFDGYRRESENRIAHRVVELLREEGLLVAIPVPTTIPSPTEGVAQ